MFDQSSQLLKYNYIHICIIYREININVLLGLFLYPQIVKTAGAIGSNFFSDTLYANQNRKI